MSVFATFDAAGLPTGFWPEAYFPPAEDGSRDPRGPVDAVEITEEQWLDLSAHHGLRRMANGTVVDVERVPAATPPRRATLSALFDELSASQRAAITADHMWRLQADAGAMPDGTVYVGSSKVKRAADDMGLTPDAWFKMAGC